MNIEKIYITGLGAISPLGENIIEHYEAVRSGCCGLDKIRFEDLGDIYFGKAHYPHYEGEERTISLAVKAGTEAIENSGIIDDIERGTLSKDRVAVIVSSSKGGLGSLIEFIKNRSSSDAFPRFFGDMVSRSIAAKYNLSGPALNYPAACATGGVSIAVGANMIQEGIVDTAIVGSVDSTIHPLFISGFKNMGVLSSDKMRPFHKDRDGFNIGEGAGALVLQPERCLHKKEKHIFGILKGWDVRCDAFNSVRFHREGESISRSISALLNKFEIPISEISYINAHGTATRENDLVEYNALKRVFGCHFRDIFVSSTKGATGHLLGAASAIEAVITILALKYNFLPETLFLDEPAPELDMNFVPKGGVYVSDCKTAISLSYGFGGHISTLAFANNRS